MRPDGTLIKNNMKCILDDCSSSDAGALYQHPCGRVNYYCYSCGGKVYSIDPDTLEAISIKEEEEKEEEEEDFDLTDVKEIEENFKSDTLKKRRIPSTVAELYGVKVVYNEEGKQESYMYPAKKEGEVVGYAVRSTFKEGDKKVEKKPELLGVMKNFYSVGMVKPDKVELFGLDNFSPEKHDRLFITTGQEDAMAGYMMSSKHTKFEGGYAFVSVIGGDQGGIKNLKANLDKVAKFKEIIICADKDESGKQFEKEALKILPIGKTKTMSWPELKKCKDLSDIWNHSSKQIREENSRYFYKQIFSAQSHSPAGIRSLSEGWKDYLDRGKYPLIPFPASFGNLNELTFGGYGADGEIVNIAAPSSVGKTSFIKEMVYTVLQETENNIGVISLEETLPEFIEGILSVHMSTQLNEIPLDDRDRELEYAKFNELLKINNPSGADRIHFMDDPGACKDEEDLWNKVDFLINGLDCKVIILDPVTLALSLGLDEDEYNATLVKKVKRHHLAWINVHHVRKSGGGKTANSEGADLAEEDMKGSGSHFQTGMINLILTRNKVHPNPIVRNTTRIKMPKCRRHGKSTGIAGYTYYNGDTGRLELGRDPSEFEDFEVSGNANEFEDDGPLNNFE